MSDSYLLAVEKALANHIETEISSDKGRPLDVTGAVFRGRASYGRGDPTPMVSLLQSPDIEVETNSAGSETLRKGSKLYLVQGWVDDDPQNPTDPAHELLAEIKRAIAMLMGDFDDSNYALRHHSAQDQPLVESVDVGVGLVRPPDDVSPTQAYCWLPVRLGLVESIDDPYAIP